MIIPAEAEILLARQHAKQYEKSLAKVRESGRGAVAGSDKIHAKLDMPKSGSDSKCSFDRSCATTTRDSIVSFIAVMRDRAQRYESTREAVRCTVPPVALECRSSPLILHSSL
jgi:hypothetical protein